MPQYNEKGPAGGAGPFFGEGISFLMGCSKNYIMYWGGVTIINITHPYKKVFTNFEKIKKKNCAFYQYKSIGYKK